MKLSVVIPALNEEGQIRSTITALATRLDDAGITDREIVVVDDGSRDGTADVIRSLAGDDTSVRLVVNDGLHGYGRAVRAGLDAITGDAVVVYMADASDDPDDVVHYYHILRDEAECAFGSRFMRGSKLIDYPWVKLIVNRIANTLIQLLFGLRFNDTTNAFKGYRRYVIDGCRPFVSPHFNLTIELPLKAIVRGYTHKAIPISWRNRTEGVSRLVLKEQGSRYLYTLLSVWFEWLLVRSDYRRPTTETFSPWGADTPTATDPRHQKDTPP